MKMKALVYTGPKRLSIDTIDRPSPADSDVLIRVLYCGVCGTDIHIYNGDGGTFAVQPPLIMGHEFSGIVESTGKNVTKVKKGDLVTVDPNDMCGECYFCKNAMQHFCLHVRGYGTTQHGGFAEYCLVHERQVFKFSKDVPASDAAMAEPLSCCLHGIDLCNIRPGSEVLIIGGGPIGLLMLQLAKMCGPAKVLLSEPVAEKRELALKLGADIVIDPLFEDIESAVKKHTKNINTVIECAGNIQAIEKAVLCAGRGAVVMLFGLTGPDAVLKIKPDIIFKKELKITSSFINPYTFERAVSIIESGRINFKDIITDVVPLDRSVEIFENDAYRKRGKTIIKIS